MDLTPAQVRDIAGVSQETLRYWRRRLAPLSGRSGHRACFKPSEALVLRVLSSLKSVGIPVGALVPAAPDLFELFKEPDWEQLESEHLVLRLDQHSIRLVAQRDFGAMSSKGATVVLPLTDHVRHVKRCLLGSNRPDHSNTVPFRSLVARHDRSR